MNYFLRFLFLALLFAALCIDNTYGALWLGKAAALCAFLAAMALLIASFEHPEHPETPNKKD